ncbi:hypothetical protein MTsPCn9_13030 [Croceitalea sp. MTPC9]|uniref:hypothetical protein n=1 Tax=unclassified Croceitalea TaxID=2632280 RepID=UPI002B37F166|nr:hypothetical protein MTsPCn6_16100 [Croceitalea sp. MTPC6]GMN16367.1 hypothetical protein MTsPCn9_13030 [Croceitalea sp. MTPC9]
MKTKKISTDRILGISAMLISLLTLIIFIYQTNIMKEQSKLSVKPRLDFTTNFDQKDSTIIIREVIENKGLGPAIIDSIYFKYKDGAYPVDIETLIKKEIPKLLEFGYLSQHATLSKGTTISPNEERFIFTYHIPMSQLENLYSYLGMSDEDDNPFPIEVIYTSIYEDNKWMMNNDDLNQPIKVD